MTVEARTRRCWHALEADDPVYRFGVTLRYRPYLARPQSWRIETDVLASSRRRATHGPGDRLCACLRVCVRTVGRQTGCWAGVPDSSSHLRRNRAPLRTSTTLETPHECQEDRLQAGSMTRQIYSQSTATTVIKWDVSQVWNKGILCLYARQKRQPAVWPSHMQCQVLSRRSNYFLSRMLLPVVGRQDGLAESEGLWCHLDLLVVVDVC